MAQDNKYGVQESEADQLEDTNNEDLTEKSFKAPLPPGPSNQSTISMSPLSNVGRVTWRKPSSDSDSSGSSEDGRKRSHEMSKDKSKAHER